MQAVSGNRFTATIVGMLAEEGEPAFDDPFHQYLADKLVDGLDDYKGTGYTDEITINGL